MDAEFWSVVSWLLVVFYALRSVALRLRCKRLRDEVDALRADAGGHE